MKIVYVFLFSFLSVVLANDEEDRKTTKALTECRKELGLNEFEDPKELMRNTTAYQRSCFVFCMEKKMGLMNEDGTYNKEAMYKVADPLRKAELENKLAYCEKKIEPGDGCKMAGCLHADSLDSLRGMSE